MNRFVSDVANNALNTLKRSGLTAKCAKYTKCKEYGKKNGGAELHTKNFVNIPNGLDDGANSKQQELSS